MVKKIRFGKAPVSLDGILSEIGKMFASECKEECLKVMDECLEKGKFSNVGKTSGLVLIGKVVGVSIKYRPLCAY